jgi:YkoY family integral membrane protein
MHLLQLIFGTSLWTGLFIILNLIGIEALLSIDNAVVLATMVEGLQPSDQKRALRAGIWGAIFLRGVCLLLVNWLTSMWVLQIIAGVWLLWLCYSHFSAANDSVEEKSNANDSKIFKFAEKYLKLNQFWSTVILVECMDMAFSTDNIFAAASFTKYIGLIYFGVFIGMVCMRYVSGIFLDLLKRFTFLENVAYIVIGVLGVKLCLTLAVHLYPSSIIGLLVSNDHFDLFFSILTLLVFTVPILWSLVSGKPVEADSDIEAYKVIGQQLEDAEPGASIYIGSTPEPKEPPTPEAQVIDMKPRPQPEPAA